MRELDLGELVPAMREALRRASLLDPAAVKELGLDLSEIKFMQDQKDFDDRDPQFKFALDRAARGMVKLRRRFVQSKNLGSGSVDAEEDFKPCVYEDGERGYLINEVGAWKLILLWLPEPDQFPDKDTIKLFLAEVRGCS